MLLRCSDVRDATRASTVEPSSRHVLETRSKRFRNIFASRSRKTARRSSTRQICETREPLVTPPSSSRSSKASSVGAFAARGDGGSQAPAVRPPAAHLGRARPGPARVVQGVFAALRSHRRGDDQEPGARRDTLVHAGGRRAGHAAGPGEQLLRARVRPGQRARRRGRRAPARAERVGRRRVRGRVRGCRRRTESRLLRRFRRRRRQPHSDEDPGQAGRGVPRAGHRARRAGHARFSGHGAAVQNGTPRVGGQTRGDRFRPARQRALARAARLRRAVRRRGSGRRARPGPHGRAEGAHPLGGHAGERRRGAGHAGRAGLGLDRGPPRGGQGGDQSRPPRSGADGRRRLRERARASSRRRGAPRERHGGARRGKARLETPRCGASRAGEDVVRSATRCARRRRAAFLVPARRLARVPARRRRGGRRRACAFARLGRDAPGGQHPGYDLHHGVVRGAAEAVPREGGRGRRRRAAPSENLPARRRKAGGRSDARGGAILLQARGARARGALALGRGRARVGGRRRRGARGEAGGPGRDGGVVCGALRRRARRRRLPRDARALPGRAAGDCAGGVV